MAKRRVVFSFDERSLESLKEIADNARIETLGETVKESLEVTQALQKQVGEGFTEIVVRNPKSNKERILIVPKLLRPKS